VKIAVVLEIGEGLPRSEAEFDALADTLYELDASDPSLEDMDLTATMSAGPFVVSMTVDADDMESALHKALVTLRSALHQVGHETSGWEQAAASMAVRLASSPRLVA
jgi:hypothetical protein